MKIAVIAGTLIDTEMGAKIIRENGMDAISVPMSKTCEEQASMQYFSKDKLEEIFSNQLQNARENGAEKTFLYCNSLSCAVDYKRVQSELDMEIISPLDIYKELPDGANNVVVLAANGLAAYSIEKIIREADSKRNVMAIGWIPLVQAIESGASPEEIVEQMNIVGLIKFIEGIKSEKFKPDSILLGCTHYPYIKEELKKHTELKIIDPTEEMLKKLMS